MAFGKFFFCRCWRLTNAAYFILKINKTYVFFGGNFFFLNVENASGIEKRKHDNSASLKTCTCAGAEHKIHTKYKWSPLNDTKRLKNDRQSMPQSSNSIFRREKKETNVKAAVKKITWSLYRESWGIKRFFWFLNISLKNEDLMTLIFHNLDKRPNIYIILNC